MAKEDIKKINKRLGRIEQSIERIEVYIDSQKWDGKRAMRLELMTQGVKPKDLPEGLKPAHLLHSGYEV